MGDSASSMKTDESAKQPAVIPEGCSHYKRKCKLVSPCCSKVYPCRVCHDEVEDHEIDRKQVKEVICTQCEIQQPVGLRCKDCDAVFGNYTCLICNLFDDEDKNQFHCEGCGICRIGGRDKFFHCPKCNMCLPVTIQNDHRCVENVSQGGCPICLEDIHTSRLPSHIPKCGHLMHRVCFDQLLHSGMYTCPLCNISLIDMTRLWEHLDDDIRNTPMPAKYRHMRVEILCKDCQKKCVVRFHVIGHKCRHCGSYNTCRIKTERANDAGESSGEQNEWEDLDEEEEVGDEEVGNEEMEEEELVDEEVEAEDEQLVEEQLGSGDASNNH